MAPVSSLMWWKEDLEVGLAASWSSSLFLPPPLPTSPPSSSLVRGRTLPMLPPQLCRPLRLVEGGVVHLGATSQGGGLLAASLVGVAVEWRWMGRRACPWLCV